MNEKFVIPNDVKFILDRLKNNGFEAFVVGGCVRDSLLNTEPKDWDITTKAKPEEVMKLFDKVLLTGIKHGTVTVLINNEGYEVTTYRADGEYEDSRHPKKVEFVTNLKEDLSRRDFTINAMAYNEEKGLVDYFGGVDDLNKKIIRTVGEPNKRFDEDALRMLRAIRFCSQLNFTIEKRTFESIQYFNNNINNISKERIRDEFNKILVYNPKGINILKECSLLEHIIPEIDYFLNFEQTSFYDIENLYEHSVKSTEIIEPILYLRLTMLLHDVGKSEVKIINENDDFNYYNYGNISKNIAQKVLKSLKYDNDTINKVLTLIEYNDCILENKLDIKRMLNKIGKSLLEDLIKVQRADIKAQNLVDYKERLAQLDLIQNEISYIIEKNECFNLKNLNINGRDLINIGINKGKKIGDILNYLLERVIENPKLNKKEVLLEIVRSEYK